MRGFCNRFSHLPEPPQLRLLPELAPRIGCRGFTGPVPPPLWMSGIGNYLIIRQKDGQTRLSCRGGDKKLPEFHRQSKGGFATVLPREAASVRRDTLPVGGDTTTTNKGPGICGYSISK